MNAVHIAHFCMTWVTWMQCTSHHDISVRPESHECSTHRTFLYDLSHMNAVHIAHFCMTWVTWMQCTSHHDISVRPESHECSTHRTFLYDLSHMNAVHIAPWHFCTTRFNASIPFIQVLQAVPILRLIWSKLCLFLSKIHHTWPSVKTEDLALYNSVVIICTSYFNTE
jgi:hypothetical protein